jgi:hypothetical protein
MNSGQVRCEMRRMFVLALVAAFGLAAVARAEPLDLKQVSAEAKWAAHVDFDALKASTTLQKLRAHVLKEHPEAEGFMAMVRGFWKFDPAKDLHSVTVWGRQMKKHTGVAIVRATVDQKLLLEKAKQAPEHRVVTYGKHELHSWLHAKGSRHEKSMTGTFYKPDVMIFGGSADEVMAALDVLDGTKPNMASKQPSLAGSIPQGAVLVAGVCGVSDADLPHKCPISKQVDSAAIAIGEYNGQVFVHGKVTAKKAETAQQMKTVAEGAIALAGLAKSDDAEAMRLLKDVKVSVADKTVNVDAQAPADQVWAAAQKAMAKAKARHMEHKDWRHHGKPEGCPMMKKPGGCPVKDCPVKECPAKKKPEACPEKKK